MRGVVPAVIASLVIAAVSTLGDLVWALYIPRHRAVFGMVHGIALCVAIGAVLCADARARGALVGAAIGAAAAGGFYLLAPLMGYAAMFVMWMARWVACAVFAIADGARRPPHREALVRGGLAAVGSGLAFYAISGIWLKPAAGGPDYAYHFLCWTIAFLPGFLALLVTKASSSPPTLPP